MFLIMKRRKTGSLEGGFLHHDAPELRKRKWTFGDQKNDVGLDFYYNVHRKLISRTHTVQSFPILHRQGKIQIILNHESSEVIRVGDYNPLNLTIRTDDQQAKIFSIAK